MTQLPSNPVKALQTKIGVTPDGSFGPATFKAAQKYFKLTNNQAIHFFAQCAHESAGLKVFEENLNYSGSGLLKIFKKYFPTEELAASYARQPQRIANRVYANRMGNGNEASGDGWKYRGRGAIQLTGKDNYTAFSKALNRPDVLSNPDIVASELAFESAIHFFTANKLWAICDKGTTQADITALTKRINGGTHGLDDRIAWTNRLKSWL